MGIPVYYTLFVATDADLDACFPGWRRPLAEPRLAEHFNPFTREMSTYPTLDPGRTPEAGPPGSLGSKRRRKAVAPILPPENDSDRWHEKKKVPVLLATFPHAAMAGSWGTFVHLLRALGLPESPPARFVDCPEDEGIIEALPEAAIGPLGSLGDREATKAPPAWQKALEIKGPWAKEIEDESSEGSAWALRRIRALAADADRRGGHVFVHAPEPGRAAEVGERRRNGGRPTMRLLLLFNAAHPAGGPSGIRVGAGRPRHGRGRRGASGSRRVRGGCPGLGRGLVGLDDALRVRCSRRGLQPVRGDRRRAGLRVARRDGAGTSRGALHGIVGPGLAEGAGQAARGPAAPRAGLPMPDGFAVDELPLPIAPSAGRSSSSRASGTRARGSPRRASSAPGPGSRRGWRRRSGAYGRRRWWRSSSPAASSRSPSSRPPSFGPCPRRRSSSWTTAPAHWPIVTYDAKWRPGTRDYEATVPRYPAIDPARPRRDAGRARPPGPSPPRLPRLFAGRRAGRARRVPDAPGGEPEPRPRPDGLPGRGLASAGIDYGAFVVALARTALARRPHD